MAVVMGRPGLGKSWLNLLFVAKAVMYGAKVGLYPLEMNLEDTALRLYSIFSSEMLGAEKALRNTDLSQGRISKQKITRFLNALEDKFKGQLFVADIGSMSDPYTVERIEAEQELHDFDLQWIDYITLMKAPGVGKNGQEDHTTVKALSNGCKQIAMRQNTVVGVSAQVSRQAISGNALLPRLEHIAYGDSIGQDADHVVSINRRGGDLYYGLVKNRHGPEIGKTRVRFSVNEGVISDHPNQIEEEE
jgi:replicative DNA helicase